MAIPRTFKVQSPLMHGEDIQSWQIEIGAEFDRLNIYCPIEADGHYGVETRSYTASLCHSLGMNATVAMQDGVTPKLRTKIRHRDLTPTEHKLFMSDPYVDYRRALRKRWASPGNTVHTPVAKILQHSWSYHPGVHDGVDVICLLNAPIYAMCRARVIDVRADGWWGLGAPKDPTVKAKGDGIIQLEILVDVGPFAKGHHLGYGHAEGALVHIGEVIEAGHHLGHAGLANVSHVHLMHNDGHAGLRGVGNLNPEPLLDYTITHS
jgi:murein DD-endopeptidase MepM/ murein hydrolase activator NlpD